MKDTVNERQVQLRAYAIWQDRGRGDGHDVEHWLMAERELERMRSSEERDRRRRATRMARGFGV